MPPAFRFTILFVSALSSAYAFQGSSAAALAQTDQLPLKYTALFGGEAQIAGVAVDGDGNAYIAGTATAALPVTAGSFQTAYKPATCIASSVGVSPLPTYPCPVAFAAKLNHEGTALVYLTYLGASNSSASAISLDGQGNAWIAGTVLSPDLPVTPGTFQPKLKGTQNIFVLKLDPTGSHMLSATYMGGSGSDTPTSLAVDANANVYVTGYTTSPDFPVSAGAFQTNAGQNSAGASVSFAAKFDASGKLMYSTYFHGGNSSNTSFSSISSIAADAAGNAYLTGSDLGGSLPTTPGAFQTTGNAQGAAFAAKLDPSGSTLIYCTYLTGNSRVEGDRIAVDGEGDAYIVGGILTTMPDVPSSFPTTPGAFQTAPPSFPIQLGTSFSFLTKLNAAGSALVYSTFLCASDYTAIASLAIDSSGSAIVAGETYAFDFPVTPGALRQCNPALMWGPTAFLLKLAPDGASLAYSTYLGTGTGTGSPSLAIAVDSAGDIYMAGNGAGSLPMVPGSFGWTGSGAFIARLTPEPLPDGSVSCIVNAASRSGQAIAPGEIVDIFGNGIGPAQSVSGSVSSGQIGTSLGGVQALFNGVLAPILSAAPNQIRAIAPFEIGPGNLDTGGSTTIQILNGSATVQPVTAPEAALAPAIFTVDGRPAGQALMINEDGSLNSEKNPARQGSVVTIYATGMNNTRPPLATGAIATEAAPLALPIQLSTSSGLPEITYAGAAPELAAGLTQINFRIPVSNFHGFTVLSVIPQPANVAFPSQVGLFFYMR